MNHILLFENFDQEEENVDFISDLFIEVSDDWNLRYSDAPDSTIPESPISSRDNAYTIKSYKDHRGELNLIITIFIIPDYPSKIALIEDIEDIAGSGISSHAIKKHLSSEFIDDLDRFVKRVDNYYKSEKDVNDINLNNFISDVQSKWSKGEVSNNDIQTFINLGHKINKSKIHSSLHYSVRATPFLQERDKLFNISKLNKQWYHRIYYYKVNIEFILNKFK